MGTISYNITQGHVPITVSLIGTGGVIDSHIHNIVPDSWTFTEVPDDNYVLYAIDSENCTDETPINPCLDCPEGFAPVGNICIKTEEAAPTEHTPFYTVLGTADPSYSNFGTLIFDSFEMNGTGIYTAINPTNSYWNNRKDNTVDGPMNRSAVWAEDPLNPGILKVEDNQDIKFSICVDIIESKTYYVGVGCDNWARIYLNGIKLIDQDRHELAVMLGRDGTSNEDRVPHKYWYIYPVFLREGENVIEVFGHNEYLVAGVGVEIYNNTKQEIINATKDFELNIIFRSKNYIGENLVYEYSPTGGYHGYECEPGYYLDTCGAELVCKRKTELLCGETLPPVAQNNTIQVDRLTTTTCDLSVQYNETIFTFSDPESDPLTEVKILKLPDEGTITRGTSSPITEGDVLQYPNDFPGGIYYHSNSNTQTSYSDTVEFQVKTANNSFFSNLGVLTFEVSACIGVPEYKDSGDFITTNGASIDIPYMLNTGVNDILMIYVAIAANTTFSTPAGWTLLGQNSNTNISGATFYKHATGSETGAVTVNAGVTGDMAGIIARFSGVNTVSGSGIYVSNLGSSAGTNISNFPALILRGNEVISVTGGGVLVHSGLTSNNGGWAFGIADKDPSGNIGFDWNGYYAFAGYFGHILTYV